MNMHKLDNQEETDKFLETFNFPKLNQEEIKNLKRSVASNETKSVIKVLQKKKSSGPALQMNSTTPLKRNEHLFFSNYTKNRRERKTSKFIL